MQEFSFLSDDFKMRRGAVFATRPCEPNFSRNQFVLIPVGMPVFCQKFAFSRIERMCPTYS